MQVHISKDGQQYGPYTVEQLREYVGQGNFTKDDHACHDGQNWVTIGQVPGFAAVGDFVTTPQQSQAVQEDSLDANTKATEFTATSSVLGNSSIILASIPLVFFLCVVFGDADIGWWIVFLVVASPMWLVGLILSIIGLTITQRSPTEKKRCRIGLYLGLLMPLFFYLFLLSEG